MSAWLRALTVSRSSAIPRRSSMGGTGKCLDGDGDPGERRRTGRCRVERDRRNDDQVAVGQLVGNPDVAGDVQATCVRSLPSS
jgi:hypothetical protein